MKDKDVRGLYDNIISGAAKSGVAAVDPTMRLLLLHAITGVNPFLKFSTRQRGGGG
jgi:hypothetical protein